MHKKTALDRAASVASGTLAREKARAPDKGPCSIDGALVRGAMICLAST